MKLIIKMVVFAALGLTVSATPGEDHKILWCHYPPGLWTGDPSTSKVLILSIDVAAIEGHLNHLGDGPFDDVAGCPAGLPM